jgi:hypothetical protein
VWLYLTLISSSNKRPILDCYKHIVQKRGGAFIPPIKGGIWTQSYVGAIWEWASANHGQ